MWEEVESCLDRGAHRSWTVKTRTGLQRTRGISWFPSQLSSNVAQAEKEAEMISENSSPEWQGSRSVAAAPGKPGVQTRVAGQHACTEDMSEYRYVG